MHETPASNPLRRNDLPAERASRSENCFHGVSSEDGDAGKNRVERLGRTVWSSAGSLEGKQAKDDTGAGWTEGRSVRRLEIACCIQTRISRGRAPSCLLCRMVRWYLALRGATLLRTLQTFDPSSRRHCLYSAAGLADGTMKYVEECALGEHDERRPRKAQETRDYRRGKMGERFSRNATLALASLSTDTNGEKSFKL